MYSNAFGWILMILLGALSGLWGQRKGYNFLCWMAAAPGSVLVCFLILPFMKDVNKEPAENKERLVRTGNITGIVLSCAYPAILMLLGFGLIASGK
jgi:hypothetical protein